MSVISCASAFHGRPRMSIPIIPMRTITSAILPMIEASRSTVDLNAHQRKVNLFLAGRSRKSSARSAVVSGRFLRV